MSNNRHIGIAVLALMLLGFAGCETEPDDSPTPTADSTSTLGLKPVEEKLGSNGQKEGKFSVVKVFYATDRKNTGIVEASARYSGERGELEYGTCEVSIPKSHRIGELEEPVWWKFEFTENPDKHVILNQVMPTPKEMFFGDLSAFVDSCEKKQAFVFIHGYNVSFEEAARRTAQMSYDLTFDGAPILYSWPSEGSETSYTIDGSNIEWTEPHLREFLMDVAQQSGAETVNLIAHSMGNRALTKVFADLSDQHGPALGAKFKEVVLTAPDVDAEVFKRDIAPRMVASGSHITLYASSQDAALGLSQKFHGYPRAGDSMSGILVINGIETIDATAASTGFLGHSYFAESPDVITDIFDLFHKSLDATKRKALTLKSEGPEQYWIFE